MNIKSLVVLMSLTVWLVVWPASSMAQWNPGATAGLGMGYGAIAMQQGVMQLGRQSLTDHDKSRSSLQDKLTHDSTSAGNDSQADANPAQLVFHSSAAVSRKLNAKFVNAIAAKHPELRSQAKKVFGSGKLQQIFQQVLHKVGYSPNNLADVMAAYLIVAWETANNADATQYPQGIAVVRRRMRQALADNKTLTSFSDAQKQEFAEILGNMATLDMLARKQFLAQHNDRQLKQLEAGVRHTASGFGVDVSELQLTDHGFVATH